MKTFYLLLILSLSFSFASAQSTEVMEVPSAKVVTESNKKVSSQDTIILDATIIKEAISRSSSDIRIFLNRERKVENIKLLFPKINKARKA